MQALNPQRTALVVIDPQVWIMTMPMAPHPREALLGRIDQLGAAATEAGCLLVHVRVAFSDDYGDLPCQDVDAPMALPPGGIPAPALAFMPELRTTPHLVVTKRNWSAFHGTELDLQLRRRGIDTIILAGVMTNFGVESTARDAWQHSYRVIVAHDACNAPDEAMHSFSLTRVLPRVSRVMDSDTLLGLLVAGKTPA
jgi:nicotinamidase-related amidase